MPHIPRSHQNNYGGVKHHPDHDPNIAQNFTDDNEDYNTNSVQGNDWEETKFSDDRLASEHHDRPEPRNEDRSYQPSNYSEGGHGRHRAKSAKGPDNADNKDYAMNKDSEQGAQQKYEKTEEKVLTNNNQSSRPKH